MAKSGEEIANEYADAMAAGDFVHEFQEGSNRTRFLTPEQVQAMADAKDRAEVRAARRTRGIFRRVVD